MSSKKTNFFIYFLMIDCKDKKFNVGLSRAQAVLWSLINPFSDAGTVMVWSGTGLVRNLTNI
jgi:hypothetical protein